jgi:hypothetical protein
MDRPRTRGHGMIDSLGHINFERDTSSLSLKNV